MRGLVIKDARVHASRSIATQVQDFVLWEAWMARSWKSILFGCTFLCATADSAWAQNEDAFFDLGTITLFGDRSAETLEDSTASVGIVDAEALDSPNNQTLTDTFRRLGNVNQPPNANSGFVIRGVNSEGLIPGGGSAPVASLYIDGIQQTIQGVRQGARGLFDTEQVEVFRGPQSTLTGRNALAGAIYVRTKDPEFSPGGRIQLTYGEDNREQIGIAYGNALNDRWAYRISGEWFAKDSDLIFPAYAAFPRLNELDREEFYNVRGKVLWLPTGSEDTRVLFTVSQSFDAPTTNTVQGIVAPNRGDTNAANPDFQEIRKTETTNFGLEVSHVFDSGLKFTSHTGYSHTHTDRGSINLGLPAQTVFTAGFFDQELTTQEFRLNYDTDRLRWVAGLYGAIEQTRGIRNSVFGIGPLLFPSANNLRGQDHNLALFGEVAYEFAPRWTVIAGGRVEYFESETSGTITSFGIVTPSNRSFDDFRFIPKLGLSYDISDDQTLSFIYQQGYRPGGSFIRRDLLPNVVQDFDAEQANNFELGYRGTLMNGALVVSANAFYQQWQDQQVETLLRTPTGFTNIIDNAGESESFGAEIEVTYAASSQVELFTSIGLLDTKFNRLTLSTTPQTTLDGSEFPSAPQTTVAVGANWQSPQGWFAGGVVQYVGAQKSTLLDTAFIVPPAPGVVAAPGFLPRLSDFFTVDVQAGYAFQNGATMTIYANNLFDEKFFTALNATGTQGTLGARREVGMRLDYEF
ncbi:MAG: TonB-dependent receptor [Pseudomonadota bacterium]